MTITTVTTDEFSKKLDKWYKGDYGDINWFNRHVTIRLGHALTFPLRLLTAPLDISIGYLSMPLTFLTFFRSRKVYHFTSKQLEAQRLFLPGLFKSVISTLDPRFLKKAFKQSLQEEVDGFILLFFKKEMQDSIGRQIESESFFRKHIFSRGLILGKMVATIATRVGDVVVGVFSGIGSIFGILVFCPISSKETIKKIKKIAIFSFIALQFLGVPGDLYEGMTHFVNPWINQKTNKPIVVYSGGLRRHGRPLPK